MFLYNRVHKEGKENMALSFLRNYRIYVIAFIIIFLSYITYIFSVKHNIQVVFTHLFYLPVLLAAYWWRIKGIWAGIILALVLILNNLIFQPEIQFTEDLLRGAIILIVSCFASFASPPYTFHGIRNKLTSAPNCIKFSINHQMG